MPGIFTQLKTYLILTSIPAFELWPFLIKYQKWSMEKISVLVINPEPCTGLAIRAEAELTFPRCPANRLASLPLFNRDLNSPFLFQHHLKSFRFSLSPLGISMQLTVDSCFFFPCFLNYYSMDKQKRSNYWIPWDVSKIALYIIAHCT